MSRVQTTKIFCDRCKTEFTPCPGIVCVDDMFFNVMQGGCGSTYKHIEFCTACSQEFVNWFARKSPSPSTGD